MLKKISMAVVCLTLSGGLVYASPYIGLSSGVIVNTSDDVGIYGNEAANYRAVPVTVFAGYGFDLRGFFYLGGELFFTPTMGELTSSMFGNYLKTTYDYGLSFIPGIQVSEHTLAYARLGWTGARFKHQDSNANGPQFGLGLQTSMTQNWDLRAEYSIATFDIDKATNRWHPFSIHDATVRSDQFNIGVVYRFI